MSHVIEELAAIVLIGCAYAIVASIPWLVDRFGLRVHTALVIGGFAAFLLAFSLGLSSATAIGYVVAGAAGATIMVSLYVYARGMSRSSRTPGSAERALAAPR